MKYLILSSLVFLSFYTNAFASNFSVTTDDPLIDFSSLDKNILIKIEKNEFPRKYVTPKERDTVLKRHVLKFYEANEDFERELFYNDLFHFSHSKLKSKYNFLDDKLIIALKRDFLKK